MKILVDARPIVDPTPGGVGRVARAILSAYASLFPEDAIVCATTGSSMSRLPSEISQFPNIHHEHIYIPNKLWSAQCVLLNASLIKTLQARIGNLHGAFLPNLGFIGPLPSDLPTTLLVHDLSFLIEPRWFTWKQLMWHNAVRAKALLRSATSLLAVSDTTKRDAIRLLEIPEQRITVIPIGRTCAYSGNKPSSARNLLVLGLHDPRKNTATAITAVRRLREEERFRDVSLTLVTGRDVEMKHSMFLQEPWIKIVAGPSDMELAKLYSTASAFLYPSWYEGYGLPVHEAAQFGVPCVASTSGALPETAPPNTIFADPAKPHHWTEALSEILSSTRVSQTRIVTQNTWHDAATILRQTLRSSAS